MKKNSIYIIIFFLLLNTTTTLFLNDSFQLPRLLIKIPTRSRPQQFFEYLDLYYQKLSKKYPYAFLITCDINDISMNNEQIKKQLSHYPNLIYTFSQNLSKVEAYNKNLFKVIDYFDILILASDDMEPIANHYDEIIISHMLKTFPNFDGVLNFDDSHHLQEKLNTYPIIGHNYFRYFGYAYFPAYKSFFCDEELTHVSRMLKKEKICSETLFKHHNPSWTKIQSKWDPVYAKNQQYWQEDEDLFRERRKQRFFIK